MAPGEATAAPRSERGAHGRLEAVLGRLCLAAGLALGFALSLRRLGDSDLWHHLRCGAWQLETGAVLRRLEFNAAAADRPFLNHEWLFQVVVALLERAGGELALIALQVGLVLATLAVLLRTLRLYGTDPALQALVLSLGVLASDHRLALRPQHFSYLFLALLLHALHLFQRGRPRALAWLPVSMALWVNLHAESLWGLVVPAVFLAVEAARELASGRRDLRWLRPLAAALGLSGLASLLNPFGARTVAWPLIVMGEMGGQVQELFPPTTPAFAFFWAYFALALAAVAARPRRAGPPWLALSALFAAVAWTANRGIPHFFLVSAPLVVSCLDGALGPERWTGAAHGRVRVVLLAAQALLLAAIVRSPAYLRPYDGVPYPEGAVRFLRAQGIGGGVFNEHLWGGFLLWHGYPGLRPVIDGRFYLRQDFADHTAVREIRSGWRALLARDRLTIALLTYPEPARPWLADALFAERGWRLVYWDDESQVYLADVPAHAAVIAAYGNRVVSPERSLLYQYAGAPAALVAQARLVTERMAALAPASYRARILAGNACWAAGDAARALGHFESALPHLQPENAWIHYQIARCALAVGQRPKAREHLERCLSLAPGFAEGHRLLGSLAEGIGEGRAAP